VVSNCPVVFAFVLIRVASVVICKRVLGVEPDRLVGVSNCPVVFAFVPIRLTPVAKSYGILGVEPDRLVPARIWTAHLSVLNATWWKSRAVAELHYVSTADYTMIHFLARIVEPGPLGR